MLNQQFWHNSHLIERGAFPFLIAEMACAHEGDMGRAKALIDVAGNAGVDAIQLQIFTRTHQVAPQHRLYPLLGDLEFTAEEWSQIVAYARKTGCDVFVFAYDVPSLRLALNLEVDGIKLSSSDLSNPAMLSLAAQSGKTVTLGTGASSLDEITEALHLMEEEGAERVVLMHGVQNFPTPPGDANLKRIHLLQNTFGLPVGYQDHTDAETSLSKVIDLVALGMGACLLEKHITLARSEKGTDHQAALEPDEFKEYVATMRSAGAALGTQRPRTFCESDQKYRQFQKKKIVASHPITKGTVIKGEAITFLRNEDLQGLSPMLAPALIGKRAVKDIEAFLPIEERDVV